MVSGNVRVHLKVNEMDQVISYIGERKDNLSLLFSKIDSSMSDIEKANTSSNITTLINRYNELKSNYNIILDNIDTYNTDLLNVIKNFESTQQEVLKILNIQTPDVDVIEFLD
ncbi:MAG: hypothetical protein R3Y13_02585 [bacterium]